ncbi:hypothetical protein AC249_AIPGENE11344 [Exaiptasia diaphana]|nr:hypothetical protein AC249_AIPGENE11344 [Exaiptasia diaphana]
MSGRSPNSGDRLLRINIDKKNLPCANKSKGDVELNPGPMMGNSIENISFVNPCRFHFLHSYFRHTMAQNIQRQSNDSSGSDEVEGYIHNLTSIKTAKKSGTNYFNCELQLTDNDLVKVFR